MSESNTNIVNKAKDVINNIIYLTVATSTKLGEPWNSPVYTAFDDSYNFYWASWQENQHSENIRNNESVFAVIYDSTAAEGTGVGVYMKGVAKQLDENDMEEVARAAELLANRKNGSPRSPDEYLKNYPRRIYKFTPTKVWVNDEDQINGNFVDNRIDITSDFLQ